MKPGTEKEPPQCDIYMEPGYIEERAMTAPAVGRGSRPEETSVACPFLHEAKQPSYAARVHTCESPSCIRHPFLPTLGELRTRCLADEEFIDCPLYEGAKQRKEKRSDTSAAWF